MVVAIFKLLLKNNLVGHRTKLVGPMSHLGYATGPKSIVLQNLPINFWPIILALCFLDMDYADISYF